MSQSRGQTDKATVSTAARFAHQKAKETQIGITSATARHTMQKLHNSLNGPVDVASSSSYRGPSAERIGVASGHQLLADAADSILDGLLNRLARTSAIGSQGSTAVNYTAANATGCSQQTATCGAVTSPYQGRQLSHRTLTAGARRSSNGRKHSQASQSQQCTSTLHAERPAATQLHSNASNPTTGAATLVTVAEVLNSTAAATTLSGCDAPGTATAADGTSLLSKAPQHLGCSLSPGRPIVATNACQHDKPASATQQASNITGPGSLATFRSNSDGGSSCSRSPVSRGHSRPMSRTASSCSSRHTTAGSINSRSSSRSSIGSNSNSSCVSSNRGPIVDRKPAAADAATALLAMQRAVTP